MTLWTPSGEHPVGGEDPPSEATGPAAGEAGARSEAQPGDLDVDVDALRRQLAEAPAEVVVANHCYGLFELAAVYLSDSPPHLLNARLAIDSLGFLVDGLGERLEEAYPSLRDALAQIRLAYVQISASEDQGQGEGPGQGQGQGQGQAPDNGSEP